MSSVMRQNAKHLIQKLWVTFVRRRALGIKLIAFSRILTFCVLFGHRYAKESNEWILNIG